MSRQSFTVEVCVIDKNDNVPAFIRESMRGSVQLGLLKGKRTLSRCVLAEIYFEKKLRDVRAEIMPMNLYKMQFTLNVN